MKITTWQRVWRAGFAELMPRVGLEKLRLALIRDDGSLIQECTSFPIPCELTESEDVECACAVGYCLWKGAGLRTVAELSERFADVCTQADDLLGETAACRLFFNWYDSTPRRQMRFELLQEVNRALNQRHESAA